MLYILNNFGELVREQQHGKHTVLIIVRFYRKIIFVESTNVVHKLAVIQIIKSLNQEIYIFISLIISNPYPVNFQRNCMIFYTWDYKASLHNYL